MNKLAARRRPPRVSRSGASIAYRLRATCRYRRALTSLYRRLEGQLPSTSASWDDCQSHAPVLQLIPLDPLACTLQEHQVDIMVTDTFQLAPGPLSRYREQNGAGWQASGFTNDPHVGVRSINIHQNTSPSGTPGTRVHIQGQTYDYFDFLATHLRHLVQSSDERILVEQHMGDYSALEPIRTFPNALSVGISLFTDGGRYLALGRRATALSKSGVVDVGKVHNAVGETFDLSDVRTSEGATHATISPWDVAARGLREEMGFTQEDCERVQIVLHSLTWDRRMLDYKFFGYAISPLSRNELLQRWTSAPDRHESSQIHFVACRTRQQRQRLLAHISSQRDAWTEEAVFSSLRSLQCLEQHSSMIQANG